MEEPPDDAVTLQIQNSPLKCSRATLMQHSDYFRAMFDGNYVESHKSVVTLKDVDLDAVTTILKVLWDHEYVIPEDTIVSVLQAATMLQFLSVKKICLERMERILGPHNCLKFWVHSETLGLREFYCKAKLVALLEFREVKNTPYFLELTSDEVVNYLGNVNLQCPNEVLVFEAAMKWYSKEEKNQDTLLKLLKCINFTAMTVEEVDQCEVGDIDIINCIKAKKKPGTLDHFSEKTQRYVDYLLSCKERNVNGFPCLLVDTVDQNDVDSTVLYYDKFKRKRKYNVLDSGNNNVVVLYVDVHTRALKRLFDISAFKCELLSGFKVTGYKNYVYFYGGEYLLGKGNWNTNIHVYDVIKEEWKSLELKFTRRHFESCVCGKYLFIVGGTGSFRVIQENVFWYDLEAEEWSPEIKLPCSGRQIKCCRFSNQLFVLDLINTCGYTFSPCSGNNWRRLEICQDGKGLPAFSNTLQVFSYRNCLYIISNKLYQLRLEGAKLIVVNEFSLPSYFDENTTSHIESVFSNGILYSLYRQPNEDSNMMNDTTVVGLLNLDTFENSEIWRTENDTLELDKDTFRFQPTLVIFNVFHPNLVDRNDLIL